MRKVFWRFYLTVALFFLASALVIGSIYKNVLNQSSQHYLSDIFKTTLYLIEDELIDVPQENWPQEISRIQDKVPVHVDVETLDGYLLSLENQRALFNGDIIMLEDSGLFLQRIPGSEYMLVLGPIGYLNNLSSLQWVDCLMLLALCLSLAIPAFLWMRPLWLHLQHLSKLSRTLGAGDFSARVTLPASSALIELGNTFNGMAHNIQQLMSDRKLMIDAVSHDLRTPLARLRYRIEALRMQLPADNADRLLAPMTRDLDRLGEMTDELLVFSSLDRPEVQLEMHDISLMPWLNNLVSELSWKELHVNVINATQDTQPQAKADPYYLGRAVTNLLTNARRYGKTQIDILLEYAGNKIMLHVDDDGVGIPEDARLSILKPFIRLDSSRNTQTGGYGMGLAIVQKIMHWHCGEVNISQSPLGGARVTLSWPYVA